MSEVLMVGLAAVVGAASAVAGGLIVKQAYSLLGARKKAKEATTMTGTQAAQGADAKVVIHGVGIKVVVHDVGSPTDTVVANTEVSEHSTTKSYSAAPVIVSPKVQISQMAEKA